MSHVFRRTTHNKYDDNNDKCCNIFLFVCRTLDPTKIITDDKRLRFSFLGITDIVTFDPNQQNPFQLVNHYQQVCIFIKIY